MPPITMVASGLPEIVGQHRAEKRHVDQSAPELLGDQGDLDTGRAVGAQGTPAGGRDGLLQPGHPVAVVELAHRSGAEIIGELGGRVPQLLLLTGQPNIHERSLSFLENPILIRPELYYQMVESHSPPASSQARSARPR